MIIYANGYYPRGGLGQLNLEEDGKLYEYTTAPVDTTISGVRSHLVGCVNHIYENRWRVESLVLTKLEEDTASGGSRHVMLGSMQNLVEVFGEQAIRDVRTQKMPGLALYVSYWPAVTFRLEGLGNLLPVGIRQELGLF